MHAIIRSSSTFVHLLAIVAPNPKKTTKMTKASSSTSRIIVEDAEQADLVPDFLQKLSKSSAPKARLIQIGFLENAIVFFPESAPAEPPQVTDSAKHLP